jgi:N6-adenosine-specific RNA methylase IME4
MLMRSPSTPITEPRPLPALYEGHYRVVYADPPWEFRSYAACTNPKSDRHVHRYYQTMTMPEINALPIKRLAHPDGCHLFLWTTGPSLERAFSTIRAWGFKYSGVAFTWVKLKRKHGKGRQIAFIPVNEIADEMHTGLGFTTRKNTEICLLARRGNARRVARDVRELIIAPVREHSRKPDEAIERIEKYCAGPYLELFSRSERPGWTAWGDQIGKWAA